MILCWIKAQDNHVDLQTYEYQGSLSDAVEPEIKPVLTRQLEVQSWKYIVGNTGLEIQGWKYRVGNKGLEILGWKYRVGNTGLEIQG